MNTQKKKPTLFLVDFLKNLFKKQNHAYLLGYCSLTNILCQNSYWSVRFWRPTCHFESIFDNCYINPTAKIHPPSYMYNFCENRLCWWQLWMVHFFRAGDIESSEITLFIITRIDFGVRRQQTGYSVYNVGIAQMCSTSKCETIWLVRHLAVKQRRSRVWWFEFCFAFYA